eukprot:snap_masked-scaffold_3-processed-gene-2.10-mRNA-1 protein AED:0.83 eAED:0.83 QI:0/-1/0/1/-1/1/1/0/165
MKKRIYWDRLYRWAIRLQSVDMTAFHISSRNNFASDLLTRWGNRQTFKTAKCFFTLDLTTNELEGDCIEDSSEFLEENLSDAEYHISDRKDWTTVLEDESRHVDNIFMGRIKVRGITIMQISRDSNDDPLEPREEVLDVVVSDLENMFVGEYISYLSPFYPKKEV